MLIVKKNNKYLPLKKTIKKNFHKKVYKKQIFRKKISCKTIRGTKSAD